VEGGALLDPKFKEFSKNHVMLLSIRAKVEGRKHDDLIAQKGFGGWPAFAVLDAEGNVIAKNPKSRDVAGFEGLAKSGSKFVELGKKAAGGDRDAQIEFAIARTSLGHIDYDDLQEILEPFGKLTKEQQKQVIGFEANEKVGKVLAPYRRMRPNKEETAEITEKFLELHKAGFVPTDQQLTRTFWNYLTQHAKTTGDAGLLESCLKEWWRPYLGPLKDNARAKAYLRRIEDSLADLRASACGDGCGCGCGDGCSEMEDG
ncbi:MAG: hypothetical protein ACE10D_00960, partial [Planctomycetota bacterium]